MSHASDWRDVADKAHLRLDEVKRELTAMTAARDAEKAAHQRTVETYTKILDDIEAGIATAERDTSRERGDFGRGMNQGYGNALQVIRNRRGLPPLGGLHSK